MKDIILWKYERASWQWDVLCLLILAFIFFTPKTWFEKKEKSATRTAQSVVKTADFSSSGVGESISEKSSRAAESKMKIFIEQPYRIK